MTKQDKTILLTIVGHYLDNNQGDEQIKKVTRAYNALVALQPYKHNSGTIAHSSTNLLEYSDEWSHN